MALIRGFTQILVLRTAPLIVNYCTPMNPFHVTLPMSSFSPLVRLNWHATLMHSSAPLTYLQGQRQGK